MNQTVPVSVIGPGALGSAMIDLVSRHSSFTLASVWGCTQSDSYILDSAGKEKKPADKPKPSNDNDLGDLTILSVPDDKLAGIVRQLSKTAIQWDRRSVIHLSGSVDSSILKPLAEHGAKTASMHPLQTFTRGDGADRFKGIWFSLQGGDELFPMLNQLVTPFGAQTKVLTSDQKSAMHLAAVFASNYLVSLMDVAEQISKDAGINDGLEMLNPIIHQTLHNIFEKGARQSLSGPVARGDQTTIAAHLKRLQNNSDHFNLYRQLGLIASQIATSSGQLDEEVFRKVRTQLKSQFDE
ncbi:Rossmann-like and DUF2520 domain-containing protein [Rhodohalobacter sp. 8-1]|uniref:Rossmann-like and DUF2520 domain-containing protein n=1 Tax=Rhodohalobacter sp. 8-1 TaxID=3131972 RepID=UPI0030EBEB98